MTATFSTALDAFVAAAQARINAYFAEHYTNLTPPTISTERGGSAPETLGTTPSSKG